MNKTFLILGALAAYLFYKHSAGATSPAGSTSSGPVKIAAMPTDAVEIWGPYKASSTGNVISIWKSPTQGFIKYNQTSGAVLTVSQAQAQALINAIAAG